MVKDTTSKKTLWGRFKSWLAGTWLGRAWSKVSSTVKGWFSSNAATKTGDADQSKSETLNNDRKVPAPGLDKEQEPNQVRNPDQEDEVDPVGNNLSATDPPAGGPAQPTPNGTPATPLSGPAGPDNGKVDMKETNQNPAKPNPAPVGGMGAAPQQGFKALIKIDGENLKFVSMNAGTAGYISRCKNPADGKECLVYVKHGEDMYRIIFTGDGLINSVAKQHENIEHMNDNAINPNGNMESAKTLFGLNDTTPRVKITEISNVPFEAPEVENPALATNGEKSSSSTISKEDGVVVPYQDQAWSGRTLYFDPKLSDYLSRASMEREKLLMRMGDPSSETDGPTNPQQLSSNGKSGPK